MAVNEGSMAGRQSLITRVGILSIPGTLLTAIESTIDLTCVQSTGPKTNWSDSLYILGTNERSLRFSRLFCQITDLLNGILAYWCGRID